MPKKTPALVAAAAAPLPLTYTTPDGRTYPVTGKKPPRSVSYSQLTAFEECGQLHHLVRNLRVVKGFEGNVYTEMGSACHEPIEVWLRQFMDEGEVVYKTPYDYMVANGGYWDTKLAEMGLQELKPRLQAYAHHTTTLYWRSHPGFTGKDAIRKADGTPASMPSMTKGWTDYAKANGLYKLESEINSLAARVDLKFKDIPFAQVYAESLGIMFPYLHPAAIASVVAVELPISEVMFQASNLDNTPMYDDAGEPVPSSVRRGPHPVWVDDAGKPVNFLEVIHPFWLPVLDPETGELVPDPQNPGDYVRRDDVVFTGFIDLVARDADGQLMIVDHKTSGGDPPGKVKIEHHEQLNLYGFMVTQLFGEQPKTLAINHLRSNKLPAATYLPERGKAAVERLLSLVREIDLRVYTKRDPFSFSNPCIKKGRNKGDAEILCPGLAHCHPSIHAVYKKAGLAA